MIANLKLWLYGVAMAVVAMVGAMLYRKGKDDAEDKFVMDDYESAEDIRRNVSVNRSDELRKYDGRGWRDD